MPKRPDPSAQMRGDQSVMTPELAHEIADERAAAGIAEATKGGMTSAIVITAVDAGRVVAGVPDVRFRAQTLGRADHMLAGLTATLPGLVASLGGTITQALSEPTAAAQPLTPEADLPPEPMGATPSATAFLDALADKLDERGVEDLANDCRREASRQRRTARS